MQRLTGLFVMAIIITICTSVWAGDSGLKVKGDVRFRTIADDKAFNMAPMQSFSELRTRIGISSTPQDNLKLFIQLQDSRLVGANSGGLANDTNVGLHQGYLDYVFGGDWSVKAGRFEMAYGSQRLVGSVGWHNVGRTWDGLRISRDSDKRRFDFFGTQLNETAFADNSPEKDKYFGGFNFLCKEKNVEAFVWADLNKTPGAGYAWREDLRGTVGVYSKRKFLEKYDYECTTAYQFGHQRSISLPDTNDVITNTDLDIAAFLFSVETGISLGEEGKCRIAALFDYASGDKDPADNSNKAFNNLYYTGHKYRGFMDYFLSSNNRGLMDAALRARLKIKTRWTVKADAHLFMSAQEFADDTGSATRSIGNEVDLSAAFKDGRFGFVLGASVFMAGDEAHGYADDLVGGETSTWGYAMCTAGF